MAESVTALAGPSVDIVEEAPREGVQIESRSITTGEKIELINRLSATGLRTIVVGSFVSPRWVPQMADVEDVIRGIRPVSGVRYRALAFNARGRERRDALMPPLSAIPAVERHATRVHLCDTFLRRNVNRRQSDEIAAWGATVQAAVDAGAAEAGFGLNAAWGSNWAGEFDLALRMDMLARQHALWCEAGIPATTVWLGDPMGWNSPNAVAEQVAEIIETWPEVTTIHLHLHDTRGLALTSAYAAFATLGDAHRLVIDTSLGGIGGCPYCGNGRATGMIPTEDFVHLLDRLGKPTGVDLTALIDASTWLERVIGRPLSSRVSHAGPCPGPGARYPVALPLVETFEEAQHFRVGKRAYAESRSPWRPVDPMFELIPAMTKEP